jgi:hypothetical protein
LSRCTSSLTPVPSPPSQSAASEVALTTELRQREGERRTLTSRAPTRTPRPESAAANLIAVVPARVAQGSSDRSVPRPGPPFPTRT